MDEGTPLVEQPQWTVQAVESQRGRFRFQILSPEGYVVFDQTDRDGFESEEAALATANTILGADTARRLAVAQAEFRTVLLTERDNARSEGRSAGYREGERAAKRDASIEVDQAKSRAKSAYEDGSRSGRWIGVVCGIVLSGIAAAVLHLAMGG